MASIRYQPFDLFERLNAELARTSGAGRTHQAAAEQHSWAPAVDIIEEEDRYLLSADIPGVDRDRIDITLENGVLTLKGERSGQVPAEGSRYRRRERMQGSFMRQFTLPDSVDTSNISASVKDGVLGISIPKQAQAQPRRITIN